MLTRAVREGRIRRLAPSIYTADLVSAPEEVVAENRWPIVGRLLPGAVIADRSAAEDGRIVSGRLFVVSNLPRKSVRLPGLEIRVRPGGPVEAPVPDLPWPDGLRMSSPARTLLDNLAESRSRGGRAARTLTLAELEDWLARKALAWGPHRLERLRVDTVSLAEAIGAERELPAVERLFDQVSGRSPPRPQAGPLLAALSRGRAWDERRVRMFDRAARHLAELDPSLLPAWLPPPEPPGELPFYESYFSNYIEGTEFTIDEARQIVAAQQPPPARPADGHDILQVVSRQSREQVFRVRPPIAIIRRWRLVAPEGAWRQADAAISAQAAQQGQVGHWRETVGRRQMQNRIARAAGEFNQWRRHARSVSVLF